MNGNDASQYLTITMKIGMNTMWAYSRDHDLSFIISDEERFIGFIAVEHSSTKPC